MLQIRSLEDAQQFYSWLQEMRETHPVWLDENSGYWHVFRSQDVSRVLADYQHFSSERSLLTQSQSSVAQRTLLGLDPPEHRRYRNLVAPFFTPQALATRLSARIAAITQELLEQARPTGHMDVASDFAYPLPATVIAELLGVPSTDLPRFKQWSDELSVRLEREEDVPQPGEDEQQATKSIHWVQEEMFAYFERVLRERQSAPRDDLISALTQASVEGERLGEEEIISFCFVLLRAGHVTTTGLLSQAIRCFDEHPDALSHLQRHPEHMPGAIEEVLRYASPAWKLPRIARDNATINGIAIPKGAQIVVWLSSANRDEEQFPDPERFDIARSPNRHMAFGHGIHLCVGAPLARLEASIALPMLLAQLPDLHVKRSERVLSGGFGPFDFRHLPVTFTPSSPAGVAG